MGTRMRPQLKYSAILCLFFVGLLALGCTPVSVPLTGLEPEEKAEIARNLLQEEPELQHAVHAVFDGMIELIGYDLEPVDEIAAGSEFTITWYWRALAPIDDPWEVFVHLDGFPPDLDAGYRQNLDHEVIGGLFPTVYWEEGQIIRDVQTAELDDRFVDTDVSLHVGFWRRADSRRMEISNPGSGEVRMEIGSLTVNNRAVFRRNEGPRLRLGTIRGVGPSARQVPPDASERHGTDGVLEDSVDVGQDRGPGGDEGARDRTTRPPGTVHALEGTQFQLPEHVVPAHILDAQEIHSLDREGEQGPH